VEVPHDEGIASHIGPEPCAGIREAIGEASVGEHAGQPLSRESCLIPDADAVHNAEGSTGARAMRARARSGVVVDPGTYGSSLYGNREISGLAPASSEEGGPQREGEEP
jgi:hypothetical protein